MSFLSMIFGFDHTTTGVPTTSMNSAATVSAMSEIAERQAK
ncbi:hypothetical protein [Bifidobacterium choerinum]|uniref:Uncharacterized protein n=1 Tax=Bifidobacterium choerinum TaxID=35760 RepID=A0A087AI67_9BIFI|nr:hypothetical protein [Bifidobacterium choerinum]KFI58467.1 hypothetical protein BCHO_0513 [Bifidobacterium choerinum]